MKQVWIHVLLYVFIGFHPVLAKESIWQEEKLMLSESYKLGLKNVLILSNKDKHKITVTFQEKLPSTVQALIVETYKEFEKSKFIEFEIVNFHYHNDEISLLITPVSLKGKNERDVKKLLSYIPSGLKFYYDEILLHDFRIVSRGNYIRIRGKYNGMEETHR